MTRSERKGVHCILVSFLAHGYFMKVLLNRMVNRVIHDENGLTLFLDIFIYGHVSGITWTDGQSGMEKF